MMCVFWLVMFWVVFSSSSMMWVLVMVCSVLMIENFLMVLKIWFLWCRLVVLMSLNFWLLCLKLIVMVLCVVLGMLKVMRCFLFS